MSLELWKQVDDWLGARLSLEDAALNSAIEANTRAGLPPIDVSPAHGKLLYLLARMLGARRVLEIGTLGGYSTIWLGRAVPAAGVVITLEANEKHAKVARENLRHAGLEAKVRVIEGKALDSLPRLQAESTEPFDFIFIDADKPSTPDYFRWALRLSRPGSVIVTDNAVRKGETVNAGSTDPNALGMRRFFEMLAQEPRVEATCIQTVGAKGHDGFVLARVLEPWKEESEA